MSTDQPVPLIPSGPRAPVPRGVVLCGIVAFSGFICYQGPSLWDEVASLRRELSRSRENAVIGYVGISPQPSMAEAPADWFRVEGDEVLLWGGWHAEQGHRWFRARPGDLDRAALSESMGRDLFQCIDAPVVEVGGGPVSDRIPGDHPVDASVINGRPCAYPVLVLDKVLLVNDEVDGTPLLVVYTRRPPGSPVFETTLDGRRLRMGFSGFAYRGRPLLYDRATEGLWVEQADGLVSLTGPDRGRLLRRIGQLHRVSWADWHDQHRDSRVLIGAERVRPATAL